MRKHSMNVYLKEKLRAALRRRNIYVFRGLPRGIEVAYDLNCVLGGEHFTTIFDVGANVGSTTNSFLVDYPGAHIWAFEPSRKLYSVLANGLSQCKRVTCEQMAVGSSVGEATLLHTQDTTMFHIATSGGSPLGNDTAADSEAVEMTTLDLYCRQRSINTIDFLKIDTEGHDLEVLRGAASMLTQGTIGCVQCECGLNPENAFHRPLEEVKNFIESYGYRMFGLYEQVHEWPTNEPHLRRANVVFASPHVIDRYRYGHGGGSAKANVVNETGVSSNAQVSCG